MPATTKTRLPLRYCKVCGELFQADNVYVTAFHGDTGHGIIQRHKRRKEEKAARGSVN